MQTNFTAQAAHLAPSSKAKLLGTLAADQIQLCMALQIDAVNSPKNRSRRALSYNILPLVSGNYLLPL